MDNKATAVTGRSRLSVARGDLPTDLFDAFRASGLVAWDIETSGLDWRRARIGTCQLYADGVGAAVVGVAEQVPPGRLAALLEDADVQKVFHHAPFDLRFMLHEWGARPASVRCTKVASKLLDPDAPNETHSLQMLVRRYVGVALEKGPVRTSNWTAPHLSPEQVEYATADVVYLPAVLLALQARIAQAGLTWLYDGCCEFLPARAALDVGLYPDVFAY